MRNILIAALLSLVVACSGSRPISIDPATHKNRTLSLVIHESPDFLAMSSAKSRYTMAEVAAAYVEGNRLVEAYDIKDPADKICRTMAAAISSKFGFQYNDTIAKSKSKKMADLVFLANEKDYLLDIETIGWEFVNDGFRPSDYYFRYIVRMQLIDVEKASSVGQSLCDYDTGKAGHPYVGYEKLIENNAAYVKQALNEATEFCVEKFKSDLL